MPPGGNGNGQGPEGNNSGGNGKFKGTKHDDLIIGTDGAEEIAGLEGDDTLLGLAGDDTLIGGSGNNLLEGGDGADFLDGGGGIDTASYASATTGMVVRLDDEPWGPSPEGSSSDGDRLFMVEIVIGSAFDDSISGSGLDNVLIGGVGDDTLNGLSGSDTLTGGDGADVFEFDLARSPLDAVITDFGATDSISLLNTEWLTGYGFETTADGTRVTFLGSGGSVLFQGADLAAVEEALPPLTGLSIQGGPDAETLEGSSGNDTIDGSGGDDLLLGQGGADVLTGGDGNDTIDAGGGSDLIDGGAGYDDISALGGDDTIVAGLPSGDSIAGGDGTDTVDFSASPIGLVIQAPDAASFSNGRSTVWWLAFVPDIADATGSPPPRTDTDFFIDVEAIVGTPWSDTIFGSAADERLDGGGGSDVLSGRGGNDTLVGGSDLGLDTFEIVASPGHEVVVEGFQVMHDVLLFRSAEFDVTAAWSSSNGDTVIAFEGGTVRVVGLEPHPELAGSVAFEPIKIGTPPDLATMPPEPTIVGDDLDNDLSGDPTVSEWILGNGGNDTLTGGALKDRLEGGDGNDPLVGSGGNDLLIGGEGVDTIVGGDGIDMVYFFDEAAGVDRWLDQTFPVLPGAAEGVELLYGVENAFGTFFADTIRGGDQDNFIDGLDGDDYLIGGAGDDSLTGGQGADTLEGDAGFDTLAGGEGADSLAGGEGHDTLTGGIGADVFVLIESPWGGDYDTVTDFTPGEDVLQFRVAEAFIPLDQSFDFEGDAIIRYGDGDFVRLEGRSIAELTETDFDIVIEGPPDLGL